MQLFWSVRPGIDLMPRITSGGMLDSEKCPFFFARKVWIFRFRPYHRRPGRR